MIRIQLLGLSLLLLFSCNKKTITTTDIRPLNQQGYFPIFSEYHKPECKTMSDFAVLSAMVGDYKTAVTYATLAAAQPSSYNIFHPLTQLQLDSLVKEYSKLPNGKNQMLIQLMQRSLDVKLVFDQFTPVSAVEYIAERAANFHYCLINEAHYNSLNRQFTSKLLKPLWKKGYRYLALEGLSWQDHQINNRKYPVKNSGYYISDFVFSNMLREALAIGYQLIPYEIESEKYNHLPSSKSANFRDSIQAVNIFRATFQNDTVGKVLIHAGYSHIAKEGDTQFRPMGSILKGLHNRDIFTVDQVTMNELLDDSKLSPYFLYARDNFEFKEPVAFISKSISKYCLVDPINSFSIDVQVYHPTTEYIHGRPKWLKDNGKSAYALDFFLSEHRGKLIQILKIEEDESANPVDQFIIQNESRIIVCKGDYKFRLIDHKGTLLFEGKFRAN